MKKTSYLTVVILGIFLIFAACDIIDHTAFQNFINKYEYYAVILFSICSFLLIMPHFKEVTDIIAEQRKKEKRLHETGQKAFATIVKIEETGLSIGDDPRLRITVSIKPELIITFEDFIPFLKQSAVQPGEKIEIIYYPENPTEAICIFE